MNVVKVQKLLMDCLSDFINFNDLIILSNDIKGTYGFELCIGNNKDYLFINYSIHDNEYGKYRIVIGFGKRSFIKDNEFKFVSMKPHYRLEDLVNGFHFEVTFNFETDKDVIRNSCEIIPVAFNTLCKQSDNDYFFNCIR